MEQSIRLDKDSKVPIHQQLYSYICLLYTSGDQCDPVYPWLPVYRSGQPPPERASGLY